MSEPTPGAPCIPERHRPDSALALRISLSPSRGEASFTSGARIRVTLCWRGEGMGGGGARRAWLLYPDVRPRDFFFFH